MPLPDSDGTALRRFSARRPRGTTGTCRGASGSPAAAFRASPRRRSARPRRANRRLATARPQRPPAAARTPPRTDRRTSAPLRDLRRRKNRTPRTRTTPTSTPRKARPRRTAAGARIAQRLVGARDLLEARFGGVITRIDVRVILPRKPLVGALDLDQRRPARDARAVRTDPYRSGLGLGIRD